MGEASHMAAGHESTDAHDSHDDHGSGGDSWVIAPLVIGLIIGLAIAIFFGLGSGAAAFN